MIAAAALEIRALLTIRDARDVAHYTRLPLLVTFGLLCSGSVVTALGMMSKGGREG